MAKKEKAVKTVRVDIDTYNNLLEICRAEYYSIGVAVKVAVNGYLIQKDYDKKN